MKAEANAVSPVQSSRTGENSTPATPYPGGITLFFWTPKLSDHSALFAMFGREACITSLPPN